MKHYFRSAVASGKRSNSTDPASDCQTSFRKHISEDHRKSEATQLNRVRLILSFRPFAKRGGSWLKAMFQSGFKCVGRGFLMSYYCSYNG